MNNDPLTPGALADAELIAAGYGIPVPEPDDGWPKLHRAAYWGLPGQFVEAVAPHTEADPVALLTQYLSAFGSATGRGPHFVIGATMHHANTYQVVVGATSGGRKGTSLDHVREVFDVADEGWSRNCQASGLSTGEGLIYRVRDPVVGPDGELADEGRPDKRLFVVEPEFAIVLKNAAKENNNVSGFIRDAWDRGTLESLSQEAQKKKIKATGAHVSIVGHITRAEAERLITVTEAANGFVNRFLWLAVRRSKLLPDGDPVPADKINKIATLTRRRLEAARKVGRLRRNDEAAQLWRRAYEELALERPGLLGAIVARGAPQAVRLQMLYALTDGTGIITADHVRASLALWDFSAHSAAWVFSDALGDPVADKIDAELRAHKKLNLTQIRDLFGRNVRAPEIRRALRVLAEAGRAASYQDADPGRPGRPTEWWVHRHPDSDDRGLGRFYRLVVQRSEASPAPANALRPNDIDDITLDYDRF